MGYLEKFIKEQIQNYPQLESKTLDLYDLYLLEIEDESECKDHEASLCITSIQDLIDSEDCSS